MKPEESTLSIEQYLEAIKSDPSVVKTAHSLIYSALMRKGVKNVFADYYGIDKPIEEIMRYLRSASIGGECSRQFLVLLGPPSTAKSSLVRTIAWAIDNEPIYYVADCPIRDSPIYLWPRKQRLALAEKLGIYLPEGDICPVCRKRLKTEYGTDWTKFRVRFGHLSIKSSRGFASVDPTDPMSFDKAKLIGSVTLGEKEGDPEHFELDGAFCRAHRGLLEIVEIFKNPTEVLFPLLEATQSKTIESPAGRTEKIYVDTMIIAHSNVSEWKRFVGKKENEPFLDRLQMIEVPHNLGLDDQIRIIEKISIAAPKQRLVKYHVNRLNLRAIAAFTIATRVKDTSTVTEPLNKVLIYNGEDLGPELTPEKLREESPEDGWFGISNRDAARILEWALGEQAINGEVCISPTAIFKAINEFIGSQKFSGPEKEKWKTLSESVRKWFGGEAGKDFSQLAKYCPTYCAEAYQQYLSAIKILLQKRVLKDEELQLLANVEMEWDGQDEEKKNDKRALTLENAPTLDLAQDAIKKGVYWHVNQRVILPALTRYINGETAAGEGEIWWYDFIEERMKLLGYCRQCLKSAGSWILTHENCFPQLVL